jgi:hypothetical protein
MWTVTDVEAGLGQQAGDLVTAQATGVLVLALRVAPDVANRALTAVAHRNGVAVEALAGVVLARAGGLAGGDPWLRRSVWLEWGDLLD